MLITQHTHEIRKLFTLYDKINQYQRAHAIQNYRREMQAGYSILAGLAFFGSAGIMVWVGVCLIGGA